MNTNEVLNKIKERYKDAVPTYPESFMPQTSAVLIPLINKNGDLYVVFEQRARHLNAQPGEICFPGGRLDPGEAAELACVRETCEELLVDADQVEILGAMNGIMGPAGAPIWPYVGVLKNYQGTFSEDEVERMIEIPLAWFLEHDAEIYETKMVTVPGEDFPFDLIPGGREYKWREKKHLVYFYRTPEVVVWGLTAHVMASFIESVKR